MPTHVQPRKQDRDRKRQGQHKIIVRPSPGIERGILVIGEPYWETCSSLASTAASGKLAAMRRSPACSRACNLLTSSPLDTDHPVRVPLVSRPPVMTTPCASRSVARPANMSNTGHPPAREGAGGRAANGERPNRASKRSTCWGTACPNAGAPNGKPHNAVAGQGCTPRIAD